MSTLYVDNLQPNLGSGVLIPGHVVQVLTDYDTAVAAYTSTSYVSTALSVTMTPTSATSLVLLIADVNMDYDAGTNASLCFFKDGVSLSEGTGTYDGHNYANRIANSRFIIGQTAHGIDSATGTTSAITYDLRIKTFSGQIDLRSDLAPGRLIAMEIAQ